MVRGHPGRGTGSVALLGAILAVVGCAGGGSPAPEPAPVSAREGEPAARDEPGGSWTGRRIRVNPLSRTLSTELEIEGAGVRLDRDLIDVRAAHPGAPGRFLPAEAFVAEHGPVAPAGTLVRLEGNIETLAWNAYLLGITEFESDDGRWAGVIRHIDAGGVELPFALVTVDGQVAWEAVVARPPRSD